MDETGEVDGLLVLGDGSVASDVPFEWCRAQLEGLLGSEKDCPCCG